MNNEGAALIAGAVIAAPFLSWGINKAGMWLTVNRFPKPVLFDWENNTETLLDLEPELFDPLTDQQLDAMFNAIRLNDLLHGESRRAPLYAVPDSNVIDLPTKSGVRVSPDAA